jgi:acyl-CoA synthetase (AMP-forming)/AMP-acid ligase II
VETIGLFAGARVVATTPLHHAFGFGFGLVASLLADSILELRPLFHPWSLMRPERPVADVLGLVPPMVPLLTRLKTSRPVRAVRHAFFAGAPCSDAAASDYERAFDQPLYQIYGTTETGGITTTYAPGKARPGAGGPLHGVSVLVARSGRFPELDADTGEVCVRSTSMMAGYLGQRLASDTWRTGDLGRWRASGELTLVGRLRDIINVAGYNVDPREVEEVLRTHPEVLDAVAYAGRNNDGSEFVQAAVCLRLPLASGQLRDFCSDRLAAHKVPQVVHPIDSIPRTPSGKCRKNELPQTAVPAPPGGGPTEIP